ncbi:MAG: VPLPA-CTERM sorting domain-containing protein [Pseudomonadota bacterium]
MRFVSASLVALAAITAAEAKTLPVEGELFFVSGGSVLVTLEGTVEIDETLLTGSGFESLPVLDGSGTAELTAAAGPLEGSYSFGLADFLFLLDPEVTFQGGQPVSLSFDALGELSGVAFSAVAPGDGSIQIFDDSGSLTAVAEGSLNVVPLPAAGWMFVAGLAAIVWLRRRAA